MPCPLSATSPTRRFACLTWPNRQAIPGAVIKPHQGLNLFFGVARHGRGRGAGGPVTYTASRNTYTLQERLAFIIVAPHTRCPRFRTLAAVPLSVAKGFA